MNDSSDAVLLRRYLDDGDEAAFAEVVRRYLGLVYHAALRQVGGDRHAAEEIAQTVFTLVARKASSLAQHEALAGWLHMTTRYSAQVHRRRESRRVRREEEARIMHENSGTEKNMAEWEKLRPLIDDVLAELNAADRDVVLLRFFTGLPFAEIGARMKVTENTARMRVERALEKLHGRLARRGVASPATALGVALSSQAMATVPAGLAASVSGAALASVATGGAWLAAGILLMKTKTIILGSVAVLAVGVALLQFKQAQDAEILLTVANRDRDALREQLRDSRPVVSTAVSQPLSGGLMQPRRVAQVTQAGSASSPGTTRQPPIIAKIANITYGRIQSLDSQYQPLYRRLGLNAAQSEKFKAIMVENARRNEALMKAAAMNSKPDPDKLREIDDQTNAELITVIRGEFGDDAVQAMDRHERTMPFRGPMDELARTLFYSDAPLSATQAEQLLDAVATHEQATQGKVDFDWMVQADLYGALLTQSSGILSAPQIDALRKATEQSLEQQQRRVMTKKTVRSIENTAVQASPAGATARPGS